MPNLFELDQIVRVCMVIVIRHEHVATASVAFDGIKAKFGPSDQRRHAERSV